MIIQVSLNTSAEGLPLPSPPRIPSSAMETGTTQDTQKKYKKWGVSFWLLVHFITLFLITLPFFSHGLFLQVYVPYLLPFF